MTRWAPDARGRLGQAAMELYVERGFDETTVAGIAERAGLTERTFFRHFADKREVLFGGQDELRTLFVDTIRDAPPSSTPLDAVALAVYATADFFEPNREWSVERGRVIASNASLTERELIKMSILSADVAAALRTRGVTEPSASLTADSGIAVFRIAFAQWIADGNTRPMRDFVAEGFAALRGVTG